MTLRRYVLSALATGLLWAVPLSAQTATGTINGRVVDGATMQPLAGANITIEGTQRGTITRADGGFILTDVPAGTRPLRASRIGYSGQSRRSRWRPARRCGAVHAAAAGGARWRGSWRSATASAARAT
jgi:TonB-dependent starch-binding outer membrane protein SusC